MPITRALARLTALLAGTLVSVGCSGETRASGERTATADSAGARPLLVLIRAADWMGSEWSEDAIKFGLREANLEPDVDYELRIASAQGDLATLPGLIDAAVDAKAKLIIALQDPTLQAAVERAGSVPVVFHLLSDPFAAGAGTSDSTHLPNVTGVYSPGLGDPEQGRRVALIKRVVPTARRVGILFSPEEALSVSLKDRLSAAAKSAGLEAIAAPVSDLGQVAGATQGLCDRKAHAIELFGNVAHASFSSLIETARACRIPVFSSSPFEILQGASASLYPDFQEGGVVAGHMIARILLGEPPASIPFHRVQTVHTVVSPEAARASGVKLAPGATEGVDTTVPRGLAPTR